MKFTFRTISSTGKSDPRIRIGTTDIIIPEGINDISFEHPDSGELLVDFYNKTENDTIVSDDGTIIKDTEFRITDIWCDDILLERWVLNDAIYYPRYFNGFLKNFPDAPLGISSPYQFNFPGLIKWTWDPLFWDWYFYEKTNREVIHHLDKDPDRVWKFRGSLDKCDDLVDKIKNLLSL